MSSKGWLSIPNILTLTRIVLTPVMVFALLRHQAQLALVLLLVAGLTDMLDGAIARFFNQRTVVGAYLDPMADKIMLIGGMVALYLLGEVPLFLFLAVLFRDVVIVLGAIFYELVTHNLKMEPSLVSKATTAMQIVCLVVLTMHQAWPIPTLFTGVAIWLAFVLTVVSGLHYLVVWTGKAVTATE
ncbi:MAG: CDP-alcohol phosphatidyltransferase family protein [Mariprofundales bacterium]|nr:CDP-alcohol phosphatidyltransferase family protein [Mariprofundales bacterium]